MKKFVILPLVIVFITASLCWADEFQMSLTASSDSVYGDFNTARDLGDGFWKWDLAGVYTEDGGTEYKWAEGGMSVGGDAVYPGISCEVGLKVLLGKAEENGYSGDVGAVAFTGRISYDFARQMLLPGAFQIYGGIDYSNEILSFLDTEDYLAFHFGLGIPLFEHASILLDYSLYDMDMDSGPAAWSLDDDVFRLGISMKF